VTKITFILPRAQPTTLQIINVRGQVVRTLTEGLRNSGYHEFTWDGTDYNGRPVVSGTYIVRLATPDGLRSSKLTRNL
jgi:flagellar hook assembly protein FlgD